VRNVAVLHVADHRGEDLFVGHPLAHHEEVGVGMLHEQEGVGDDGHRRGVDDDVFVHLLQQREHLAAFGRGDELGGVGRDGPRHQDVEVVDPRGLDHLRQGVAVGQVGADPLVVGGAEIAEYLGLPQVEPHQQGLLAVQGKHRGEVHRYKGLARPHHVGGDEDGLPLLALQQVVDVGADGAEGLGAGRFGRIDHHPDPRLFIVHQVPQEGEPGHLLDLLAGVHRVVEIIFPQDEENGQQQPDEQRDGIVEAFLRETTLKPALGACSMISLSGVLAVRVNNALALLQLQVL